MWSNPGHGLNLSTGYWVWGGGGGQKRLMGGRGGDAICPVSWMTQCYPKVGLGAGKIPNKLHVINLELFHIPCHPRLQRKVNTKIFRNRIFFSGKNILIIITFFMKKCTPKDRSFQQNYLKIFTGHFLWQNFYWKRNSETGFLFCKMNTNGYFLYYMPCSNHPWFTHAKPRCT